MASYAPTWLYAIDQEGDTCEIFNSERLLGALGVEAACNIFSVKTQECLWQDGTATLALDPCSMTPSGVQTWDPLTYGATTDPQNPAPWWDGIPGSPSSQAYGFLIEEWTGLDGAHHTRSVANRAGRRGGANFGPISSGHRVMKMNLIAAGANQWALEDLMRWLETTLLDCCDPCLGNDLLIRTTCPPDGDPGFGVYRLHGAALLEGPTWEDNGVDRLGCYVRRMSLTIGAADPCLYSCGEVCVSEEALPQIDECIPFSLWWGCNNTCQDFAPYRICCPVPETNRGQSTPIVTIVNNSTQESVPLRIYGMVDPLGIGCDPCSLPICQDIRTQRIPAGGTLVVDSSTRRTLYKDADTGQLFVDGTPLLDPDPGTAPTYLSISCDPGWVVVEPAAFCGNSNDLAISIDLVTRTSCC